MSTFEQRGGLQGHSEKTGGNHYALFSVDTGKLDAVTLTGKRQAMSAFLSATGIGHKTLIGSYDGNTEISWIINLDNLKQVYLTGMLNDQESILTLGACDARDRRPATLHGIGNTWEKGIGLFQSTTREKALKHRSWTYDPSTGNYFICKQGKHR